MIQRKVSGATKSLYLTFDDGPHPEDTFIVLDILDFYKVKATFFLVAEKALQYASITQEIQRRGHAIGNHSLDHRYGVFFRGKVALSEWVLQAEKIFQSLGVAPIVGFRPPVGIVTPELKTVLQELKMPLILWNTRFFDSLWRWTEAKALRALKNIQPGSIILLHDVQRAKNKASFQKTLKFFIARAQEQNWQFEKLEPHRFQV